MALDLVLVGAPAPLLTPADVKPMLHVEHDEDDELIEGHIATVVEGLDGPAGTLRRADTSAGDTTVTRRV